MVPDVSQWRSDAAYDYFDDSSVPDLCWEGLRRSPNYQRVRRPESRREVS